MDKSVFEANERLLLSEHEVAGQVTISNGFAFDCANCHDSPEGGTAGNPFGSPIYLSCFQFLMPSPWE